MCADDTTSLYSDENLINLEITGNTKISELTQNFASLKLMVNSKKTASMIFKPARKILPFEPTVQIAGNIIQVSSQFKVLGLNIDENLNWANYIQNLTASKEASLSVYYALVESHLRYAAVL